LFRLIICTNKRLIGLKPDAYNVTTHACPYAMNS